jgi:hypothetical protein
VGTLYSPVDFENALFLAEEKSLARFGGRGVHSPSFFCDFFSDFFFRLYFRLFFQTFFFRLFSVPGGGGLLFHLVFSVFVQCWRSIFFGCMFRLWIPPCSAGMLIVFFRR